ncbi:Hypothetical protein NTJ_03382 [Nesidiocoris tenuis]|uniref:Reverse transcriptase zinc-binding domain-containing protein n=1 Tax=Nesidiocoris tenuis TaxID=355587 RepID=A0ABN7AEV7_9HEMI|nr:Hypothetical protein NTJ_03382 [Nesidiocoris tenuis]
MNGVSSDPELERRDSKPWDGLGKRIERWNIVLRWRFGEAGVSIKGTETGDKSERRRICRHGRLEELISFCPWHFRISLPTVNPKRA